MILTGLGDMLVNYFNFQLSVPCLHLTLRTIHRACSLLCVGETQGIVSILSLQCTFTHVVRLVELLDCKPSISNVEVLAEIS